MVYDQSKFVVILTTSKRFCLTKGVSPPLARSLHMLHILVQNHTLCRIAEKVLPTPVEFKSHGVLEGELLIH